MAFMGAVMGFHIHIRHSLRALRKTPPFTIGAILTVALTVGSTTAIFSVVYAVLLRQLPYRQVERLVWVWSDQVGRDRGPFNVPDFIDYRASTRTLSGLAAFFAASANLADESATERIQGLRATGNVFDVLGAHARLGRLLQPGDEQAGADHVVVLTEPFWIRRFGGDPAIVGRAIRLNGEEHTVIGVLAGGFVMPIRDIEIVLPFSLERDPRHGARGSLNFIIGVGRLRDDVTQAQASAELVGIAQRLQAQFPVDNARKRGVLLFGPLDGIVGPFRTALLTVFAAVGAVLLIACANLANLMLTRATSRRRDLAVQLALGSSRATIVVQVLIEALLVGVAGGLLGVLVARAGVQGLIAMAPTALPRMSELRHAGAAGGDVVGVDLMMLLFSLSVSIATAVLFGVIPAMMSARVDVRDALQDENRGATAGAAAGRTRGVLVSVEVALAVVLLIAVTLLAKSFANVQAIAGAPGFDPNGVLSARLALPAKRFHTRDAILTFQRALTERVAALPGVTHTGAVSLLPLSGQLARVPFTIAGRDIPRERVPVAQYRLVTAGYFDAARIPLKRGRTFSEQDNEHTRAVAIVSEELARQWLDSLTLDPVGAHLLVNDTDSGPRPVEIVGVVGNVPQMLLDAPPTADLYLPYAQLHADNVAGAAANMYWIVRTGTPSAGRIGADPMSLATSLTREIRRVDPDVAAAQLVPLDRYLSDAIAPRRFSLTLIAAFAIAALMLSMTGIYAVIAYAISQRARELGIRMALGASRGRIIRLVMMTGLRAVAIGLAAGLVVAAGITRLLSTMLFGLTASDVPTFVQVMAAVAIVSLVACAVPAARVRPDITRP